MNNWKTMDGQTMDGQMFGSAVRPAELFNKVSSLVVVGQTVWGRVRKIVEFGVFCEIADGFDALLHVSKIRGLDGRMLADVFQIGSMMQVEIYEIDHERRRIQLSCTLSEPSLGAFRGTDAARPVASAGSKAKIPRPGVEELVGYSAGQKLEVVVSGIVPYGVFCVLPSGSAALMHFSKIGNLGGRALSSIFAVGSRVMAVVDAVDLKTGHVQLACTLPSVDGAPSADSGSSSPFEVASRAAETWIADNPDKSVAAREWLVGELKKHPIHQSLVSALTSRFGVPKPVSAWIDKMPEIVRLSVDCNPVHQPAVAYREYREFDAYWKQFVFSLDAPTGEGDAVQPATGATGRTPNQPKTGSERMNLWIATHPAESAAAKSWLSRILAVHPMHGTLLSELTKRFGVPRPVQGFVRHWPEFGLLPLGAAGVPGPGMVVLASRAADADYCDRRNMLTKLEAVAPCGATPVPDPITAQNPSPVQPEAPQSLPTPPSPLETSAKTILVDGSNVVRAFPREKGGRGLALLLGELRKVGYEPHLFYDATLPYVLKEAGDAYGQSLLKSMQEKEPQHVTRCPGGTRADDFMLLLAERKGCDLVSNDMFRDERYGKYTWLKNKAEDGRRLHAVVFVMDELLVPSLGIAATLA